MRLRATTEEQREFRDKLWPVAARICPLYGLSPEFCYQQAALHSDGGRFVLAHNYWGLQGRGDEGYFWSFVPQRHSGTKGGGWKLREVKLARFSSLPAAVEGWCLATSKGRATSP